MKKYLIPILLAVPLLLSACGQTDFKDEAEKEAAFAAAQCQFAVEKDLVVSPSVAFEVLEDENATKEDRSKAMRLLLVSTEVIDNDWDYVLNSPNVKPDFEPIPHYNVNPAGDDECFGWTWDKYLESELDSSTYEDFTFEEAKEQGVLEN